MINTQQIIVLMPLFSISLPDNASVVFGVIMQIASADLIPTDDFYDNYFDMDHTDAINDNFAAMGFNSMFFLYNMGSLIVAWLSIPLSTALALFLRLFKRCFSRSPRLTRWYTRLHRSVFWSYPINVFTESASIIYMCCLINLLNPSFTTPGNKVSLLFAIFSLIVAIALPIVFLVVTMKNFAKLEDPEFKAKYGAMYKDLDTKRGRLIALQPFFFYLRRFLLAIMVCNNQNVFG
jgi:hypothetical protein